MTEGRVQQSSSDEAAHVLCATALVVIAYAARLHALPQPVCIVFDPCPLPLASFYLQGSRATLGEAADGLCAMSMMAYVAPVPSMVPVPGV